jgi:geranylgeranylglycerol-phosphate geranylgeranyltransferase
MFLSTAGAWINTPSPYVFITKEYWIIMAVTLSILSASMILNDLCDYNIDKINNPNRPLITGEVKRSEAIIYCIGLLSIPQLLIPYINAPAQELTKLITVIITLYTPILKRIPIIKNLTCAFVVAYSVLFSGISTGEISMQLTNHSALLSLTSLFLFFGSFYNEMLLDITDIEGDKRHNIHTLPVIFGKEWTWKLAKGILMINRALNIVFITMTYNIIYTIPVYLIFRHIFLDANDVKMYDYSKEKITETIIKTQAPMVMLILYYSLLSWLS